MRSLNGIARWIFLGFATSSVVLCILQIWSITIAGWLLQEVPFLALFITLLVPPVFLRYPATKKDIERIPWYDILFFTVTFIGGLYIFLFASEIRTQGWAMVPPTIAVVIGSIYLIAILEACRRTVGVPFTLVIAIFLLYL